MKTFFLLVIGVVFFLSPGASAADLPAGGSRVTFNKHIAPVLFKNCAGCHHPGEVAPFSLLSYGDAKRRAKQLAQVTSDRFMPPWKSVEGHGKFLGERRLTLDEITLIGRWVEQGAIEGDARDLLPSPKFAEEWKLGQPDLIVTMEEPYQVPADGPDVYRNFVFSFSLPPGKYIKALEYRPSNRRVVHHALFAADPTGKSRKDDEADPQPGYKGSLNIPGQLFPGSLAAWAPGRETVPLPEGVSMPWKKGGDLVLQLHLHPSGKPEEERSSLGFFFTDEPPQRSMVDLILMKREIDIPAGERAYKTRDELTLPVEMKVFSIFPHMHLVGRDMKLTAHPPQGEPFSLLWVNDWDFNWQSLYQCEEPVRLPAGTRLVMEGIHDNSADNFRNPNNPPQRVTSGEETKNEMSAMLVQLVPVQESDLEKTLSGLNKRIVGVIRAESSTKKP